MYRTNPHERLYICPQCASPERAPLQGGPVVCARCRTPYTLPDRSAVLAAPPPQRPSNDPARLAHLRVQDGRPRIPPPTLIAVLGGNDIQPGRESEAIAIWQSLRARAQHGDVAASEDLTLLTLMIAQCDAMKAQAELTEALSESALDAAVLPRHRQEQLGRLCRVAVARGERARAGGLLGLMVPAATELETDSEFRVSTAFVAAMDRDGARILDALGPQKDAVPIADSMDELASVIRAHGYELMGNAAAASQILRELPNTRTLAAVQERYPSLGLCAQSSHAFVQATSQAAAQHAAASAGGVSLLIGGILALIGLIELAVGVGIAVFADADGLVAGAINGLVGLVMIVIGVVLVLRGRAKGRRAGWLRLHGLSLGARIVNATMTGTRINDVPIFRFMLHVAGPQGPYQAAFDKLVPEHQVAMLLGRDVRVRANPTQLTEVILEE